MLKSNSNNNPPKKIKKLNEINKEDISSITHLRVLINNLLNSEKEVKKTSQILSLWLQKDQIKK